MLTSLTYAPMLTEDKLYYISPLKAATHALDVCETMERLPQQVAIKGYDRSGSPSIFILLFFSNTRTSYKGKIPNEK